MIKAIDSSERIKIIASTVTEESYSCPSVYSAEALDGQKYVFRYRYGTLRVWHNRRSMDKKSKMILAYVHEDDTGGYITWQGVLDLIPEVEEVDIEKKAFEYDDSDFKILVNGLRDDPVFNSVRTGYSRDDLPQIIAEGIKPEGSKFRLEIKMEDPASRLITITVDVCDHVEKYRHRLQQTCVGGSGGEGNDGNEMIPASGPEQFIEDRSYRDCLIDCAMASYELVKNLLKTT